MLRVCLCSVSVTPPSLLYYSALVDEMRVWVGLLLLTYDCLFGFVVDMRWDIANAPVSRISSVLELGILMSDEKKKKVSIF